MKPQLNHAAKIGALAAMLALAPVHAALAQNTGLNNNQPVPGGGAVNNTATSPYNYHVTNPGLDVDPNIYSPSVMPPSGLDIDPDSSYNYNTVPGYGNTTNTTTHTPGYNDRSGFSNDPNSRYNYNTPGPGMNTSNTGLTNNDQTRNTHMGSPNNTQRQGTTDF